MNGCHLEILNILWEISAEGVFSDFFFLTTPLGDCL